MPAPGHIEIMAADLALSIVGVYGPTRGLRVVGERARRAWRAGTTPDKGAYDDLPDGVLVADDAGTVVLLNPAGARLIGVTPDAAVGQDYRTVLPLTDDADRDWWACSSPYRGLTSRSRQPERRLTLAPAGRSPGRQLLVTARYVRAEPGGPVVRLVVCFRDSAARERHERNRADLVSTVAHELRSPLTSVKGFTATLLAKWDRFTDDQKKVMLATVNADADRVTRLLSELLDVSRIEAGRLEVRRQVVDVAAKVRTVIAARIAGGEAADRFVVVVEGAAPELWLDPDKVTQILGNLLENAVRHGAGVVTTTVTGRPDGVVVTVADEGEGVSVEDRTRVFTKFWRANRGGGTGLGLYIVKGLVEAHGGTIEAGSAPGGGALFRLFLPAGSPPYDG